MKPTAADEDAVRLALAEARRALPAGDVPIGAVVLDARGQVLATGFNRREADGDPTAHAEVLALREAAGATGEWRLAGCTLAVTLEPCTMCAGAAVLARVDRIVFGAFDPKAGAVGSLWDVVRDPRLNHRPEVVGGVLADECGALIREFFATHRD
jgi:tRNA(adenine34) deaminase